jgi:hypothetical protein
MADKFGDGRRAFQRHHGNNSSERSCFKGGKVLLNGSYLCCVNGRRFAAMPAARRTKPIETNPTRSAGVCADLHYEICGFPWLQAADLGIGTALRHAVHAFADMDDRFDRNQRLKPARQEQGITGKLSGFIIG